jgi:hypothetical protein
MYFKFPDCPKFSVSHTTTTANDSSTVKIAIHFTSDNWHVEPEPDGWFTALQNFNAIASEKGVPTAIFQAQCRGEVFMPAVALPTMGCPFISGVSAEVAFYWYVTMGSFALSFFDGAEIDASKTNLHVQMDVDGDGGANFDSKKLALTALKFILGIIRKKNATSDTVDISVGNKATREQDDPVVTVPTFVPHEVFSYVVPEFNTYDPANSVLNDFYLFWLRSIRWKKLTLEQIDAKVEAGDTAMDIMAELFGTTYDANCNTCENPHECVADDWSFNSPAVPPGTPDPDPIESWDRPWQENGSSGAPRATIGYVQQEIEDAHLYAPGARAFKPSDINFGRTTHYHDDGSSQYYTYTVPSRYEVYWLDRMCDPSGQVTETQKLCRFDAVYWLYSQYQQNAVVQQAIVDAEEKRVDEAASSGAAGEDDDIEIPNQRKENAAAAKKKNSNGGLIALAAAGLAAGTVALASNSKEQSQNDPTSSSEES